MLPSKIIKLFILEGSFAMHRNMASYAYFYIYRKRFAGLILLFAYSSENLSDNNLTALTGHGSEKGKSKSLLQ